MDRKKSIDFYRKKEKEMIVKRKAECDKKSVRWNESKSGGKHKTIFNTTDC